MARRQEAHRVLGRRPRPPAVERAEAVAGLGQGGGGQVRVGVGHLPGQGQGALAVDEGEAVDLGQGGGEAGAAAVAGRRRQAGIDDRHRGGHRAGLATGVVGARGVQTAGERGERGR